MDWIERLKGDEEVLLALSIRHVFRARKLSEAMFTIKCLPSTENSSELLEQ